jgi:hypothetical protein
MDVGVGVMTVADDRDIQSLYELWMIPKLRERRFPMMVLQVSQGVRTIDLV